MAYAVGSERVNYVEEVAMVARLDEARGPLGYLLCQVSPFGAIITHELTHDEEVLPTI